MAQASRLFLVGKEYTETGTFAFTGEEARGIDGSVSVPEVGECVRMRSIAVVGQTNPKSIYPPLLAAMKAGDLRRLRKPGRGSHIDDTDAENDGELRGLARLSWRLRNFSPVQFRSARYVERPTAQPLLTRSGHRRHALRHVLTQPPMLQAPRRPQAPRMASPKKVPTPRHRSSRVHAQPASGAILTRTPAVRRGLSVSLTATMSWFFVDRR